MADWNNLTVYDGFAINAEASPDAVAVQDPNNRSAFTVGEARKLTYKELSEYVDKIASGLLAFGIKKGDAVIVQMPTIVELTATILACAKIGAIVSPVKPQYKSGDIKNFIQLLQPKLYVTAERLDRSKPHEEVLKVYADFASLSVVVLTQDPNATFTQERVHSFTQLENKGDVEALKKYVADTKISADDVYTCAWSSGSTGDSKGIVRSHKACIHFARDMVSAFGLKERDPRQTTLQTAPCDTWMMFVPWIVLGGRFYLGSYLTEDPKSWEVMLYQICEVSWVHMVPVVYGIILKYMSAGLPHMPLQRVKWGSVATPLPEWVLKQFHDAYKVDILNMYACNEGGALFSRPSVITDAARRANYFEKPGESSPVKTKLVHPETRQQITEVGVSGELLFNTPGCFEYYAGNETMTKNAFEAGTEERWIKTGDLWEIANDDAGNPTLYKFVCREKEIVKCKGVSYSPVQVETAITAHPKVMDAAAVGIFVEESADEVFEAVVQPNWGSQVTQEEILKFLKEEKHFHDAILPRAIHIVHKIPKTPAEKVKRSAVRELIEKLKQNPQQQNQQWQQYQQHQQKPEQK